MVSVPVDLPLKLIDTLKPLAVVAEKLKHCHVVEVCEPTPDNTSRNIIPMPREWFERTADDLEAIAVLMHGAGVLSEGQASALTGLDRVEIRKQVDALTAAPVREEGGADLTPLADDPAVSALCDSNYRAGALAGWNAANHSDTAEGERIMARIRRVDPGALAPIVERNRLRALATREEAPDWTARTEAAWAENNREEAPADHVSDARQMVEAPAEAGESSLVDWFSRFVEAHQEGCGPDTDALIACLDRVRDSYRAQPQAREEAPAETGADDLAARLRRAETWDLDADQEARDRCGVLMLEAAERLEALRAQPQAREEAQPVAKQWRACNDQGPLTAWREADWRSEREVKAWEALHRIEYRDLFTTPPAPEAEKMRVAVEALEGALPQLEVLHSIVSGKETRAVVWREITKGRKALAALQQEGRDRG